MSVRSARRHVRFAAVGLFALLLFMPARAVVLAATGAAAAAPARAAPATPGRAQLYPLFAHAPLDGAMVLTGTFGEYRPGRFHAGLDYSTGEHVGLPVYAPLDGFIERVRASGAGYGRSIYLKVPDGRLIVLAHLDAFNPSLASFVAAAQDSSGQYEQDLWPEPGRFKVKAGERLGWSGQSGIGEPHLHLEVRRGDMALNPFLAGAWADDSGAPVIPAVAIEPRDERSSVNGQGTPLVLRPPTLRDTVNVDGFARIAVEAHDPGARRADMEPYEIEMSWNGRSVSCRFDSLSWATDMPEGDIVYDRGRALPAAAHGVRLCVPSEWTPRVIAAAPAGSGVDGTLGVVPEDSLARVRITARDFAGHEASCEFVVRAREITEHLMLGVTQEQSGALAGFGWKVPAALFERTTVTAESLDAAAPEAELKHIGHVLDLKPWWLAMRSPMTVRSGLAAGEAGRRVGLYVTRGNGWEYLRGIRDSLRSQIVAECTHLGRFALFEDVRPPRLSLHRAPPRPATSGAYSSWALECGVIENGSGVDVRASAFVVDGKRRPSEWDAEKNVLRWRPLRAPARGPHRFVVTVVDRAGNAARQDGTFVLD